jgi:tyrosyl-tRNA synthetase
LFSNSAVDALKSLDEAQLLEVMDGVPRVSAALSVLEPGLNFVNFLAESGVFPSRGEARKMVQAGGVSVNKTKVSALDFEITAASLLNGKYLLLQKGKSNYYLAVFE